MEAKGAIALRTRLRLGLWQRLERPRQCRDDARSLLGLRLLLGRRRNELHRPHDERRLGFGQHLALDRHQRNDDVPSPLLKADRQNDAEARKSGQRNGPGTRADRVSLAQRRCVRQAANAHEAIADQRILRAHLDRQRAFRCRLGQHDRRYIEKELLLLGLCRRGQSPLQWLTHKERRGGKRCECQATR